METSITLSVERIAREISEHMNLRKLDFITAERYSGILFGIQTLVGEEIYSQAIELAKQINNK